MSGNWSPGAGRVPGSVAVWDMVDSSSDGGGPRGTSTIGSGQCVASPAQLANESAAATHDQPAAAELEHVLAEDLARAPVADVIVERAARVGDLAVACAPDQGRTRALPGAQGAAGAVRRPRGGAGAGAPA